MIDTILVPQGAEYAAVRRGLSRVVVGEMPDVVPIPVGIKPLTNYLQQLLGKKIWGNEPQPKVLVMGLCGSLSQKYAVGDIVLYDNCRYCEQLQVCDRSLTAQLNSVLSTQHSALPFVKSLTSDRVISSATEKRHLGETLGVDVVDMEGFAALELLHQAGVAVAMLRVVSDDCHHDIPDISAAINPDGSLQPLILAQRFLRQPVAATHLIRGSLRGLKVLEQMMRSLFSV
ncbi:phosphorylase [Nostoc sp. TCL26-01]|uniref:5'-methylthioadenosine/S-adenosylhomocysteine nucleosidase family protein n=1 Tax=Nostoc sp. TCL26-01 TaxID=2576904 RepID=UPI0015B8F296|nr:phosphorylase [Nostoc sp. TCL26-01]QLE56733.1 phosphorylase [Nostoc sp. TCL26-01]